jgi:hypothetical protein
VKNGVSGANGKALWNPQKREFGSFGEEGMMFQKGEKSKSIN